MHIFEIIVIVSLIIIAIGVAKLTLKTKQKLSQKDLKEIRKHWANIKKIKTSNKTKAILDADKLLNLAFKKRGINGSTGHQLKIAGKYITNLQSTWNAHKLRNKAAHELTDISQKDTITSLKNFKNAINDLTNANLK